MTIVRLPFEIAPAVALTLVACLWCSSTLAAEPEDCLNEVEVREAVSSKRVVPQIAALRAARTKAGGEAVRARLCRNADNLVYRITALKRDGRVIRVVVDGASGKVLSPN